MAEFKGIDVSKWQGDIDYNKVKASGVQFVIIKAGEKNFVDGKFEQNYQRATAAGLSVGAYWFTHATTEADMKAEAETCMAKIAGKRFDYPIYCDFEMNTQLALPKATQEKLLCTWMETLKAKKWYGGIYMSKAHLQKLSNATIGKYPVWVAQYYSRCTYTGSYGMWQNSSTGKIAGISGNVDTDISYVYYPDYIKRGGYNGYDGTPTPEPAPQKVSVTALMPVLRSGSKGDAVKVWQTIVKTDADGKYGSKTLAATKDFQAKNGLTPDGVVGAKTWPKGLESLT